MSPATSNVPVLILGAGPVGLMLACELRRRDIAFRIVDKAEGVTKWSKALVVHARTMELFERMEILPRALERGRRVTGATIRSNGREVLHLNLAELDAPHNFFLDLNQSDTEALLEEKLGELGGQVEWQSEAIAVTDQDDHVEVTVRKPGGDSETIRCSFLCACDGAHSLARDALKLDFPGARNAAQFLLADVRLKWDRPQDHWYAEILDDALFFAAGLKEANRWRVITEVPRSGTFSQPETLARGDPPTLDDLNRLLAHNGYESIGAHDPEWLSWFKVNHRILDRFKVGRVFFAGDAAHLHPPVGGQGMNIGLHDAFNLAWKLALVIQGRAPEALLESYHDERHPAAADVVEFTNVALQTGLAGNRLVRGLRDAAVILIDHVPPAKRQMERILSEVLVNYRSSPIVGGPRTDGGVGGGGIFSKLARWRGLTFGPQPGDRAPDGRLRLNDESVARLFELTRGVGFHLLYFAGNDPDAGRTLLTTVRRCFGDGFSMIEVNDAPGGDGDGYTRVRDDRFRTREAYGCRAEGVFLIRPDGYLAFRSQPVDTDALLRQIETMVLPTDTVPAKTTVTASATPVRAILSLGAAAVVTSVVLGRTRQSPTDGKTPARALALAAIYAASSTAKLATAPNMRAAFDEWRFPPGAMPAIGVWELATASALLMPQTRAKAGTAAAALMVGAALTHVRSRQWRGLLGAVALGCIASSVALSRRKSAARSLG